MSLGDTIRKGTGWLFSATLGRRIIEFGFGVVLARLLAPEDFGVLVTISIFTGFASYFAAAGTATALIRSPDVEETDFDIVFTAQLFVGIIIYLVFFTIAPSFGNWYGSVLFEDLLRVSALAFIIRPLQNVARARLYRDMRFKSFAIIDVGLFPIAGATSVLLALLGSGTWALVLGGLTGSLVSSLVVVQISDWQPNLRISFKRLKEFVSFGAKITINDLVNYFKGQTANFVIGRVFTSHHLGLFNKGDSLSRIPQETLLSAVVLPLLRGLAKAQGDKDLSNHLYFRSVTLLSTYTLPIYVLFWWLAEPLVVFVYGEPWREAGVILGILAVRGLFVLGTPSSSLIAANDMVGKQIWITLESFIVLIFSCLVGYHFDLYGVAWGIVFSSIYTNFRIFSLARKILDSTYKRLFSALYPIFLLNAGLFVFLTLVHNLLFTAQITEDPVFYLFAMSFLGSFMYISSITFLPIRLIESEANRIKSFFKFIFERLHP